MRKPILLLMSLAALLAPAGRALAELQSGPPLPYHVVRDWAQLPVGWNFVSGFPIAVRTR